MQNYYKTVYTKTANIYTTNYVQRLQLAEDLNRGKIYRNVTIWTQQYTEMNDIGLIQGSHRLTAKSETLSHQYVFYIIQLRC